MTDAAEYQIHACLPFVEIHAPKGIPMGPVIFWPADKAEKFLEHSLIEDFSEYLSSVTQLKTWSETLCKSSTEYINTIKLSASSLTCVSIDSQVPAELRDSLLVDAVYLLFFCGAFSHLFSSATAPRLDVFSKVIPASPAFLKNRDNWKEVHILEAQRESPVTLEHFDEDMCAALGHALACGYQTGACRSKAETAKVQSLIRSIRYFVDRFFERFEILIGRGLSIPSVLFEAEDIVFLATSFEALFDLSDEHPHIDFKHKLRPMLGLRYSNAVELLWQWVDGFFDLREQIVHGRPLPDATFQANPNFDISYFYLGMKLFLYGVYCRMHAYQLLSGTCEHPGGSPLNFKWITPEEILAFFWPEEALFTRICKIINELEKEWNHPDLRQDLTFMGRLLLYMLNHYSHQTGFENLSVRWKPTPTMRIQDSAMKILATLDAEAGAVTALLPLGLKEALQKRLHPVE